jgi:RimJ/RimL family protein N-acetyltransferase
LILNFEPLLEESSHLVEVVDWLNNQSHMKFSSQHGKEHTVSSQKEYIRTLGLQGNAIYLALGDGVACGTFSLIIHKQVRVCEIGLLVSPIFKGRGIGNEIFKEASKIAFTKFNARKIRAGCVEQNTAMLKVFTRNNLQFEARLADEGFVDGKYQDVLLYTKFF